MNRNSINVGKKIKTYRKAKKYTLKNLAEKTGLSIGFLSQLERGMTTIAIDSLFNLANVLDVDIMDFFDAAPKSCDDPVVHSYSRPVLSAAPETVQFYLGGAQDHNFQIVPKLLQLMPSQRYLMCPEQPAGESREKEEDPGAQAAGGEQGFYKNHQEEFVYVLEGILSLEMDRKTYTLYPEDSIQIAAGKRHCWSNQSNRIVKMLLITVSGSEHEAEKNIACQGGPFPGRPSCCGKTDKTTGSFWT